MKSNYLKIKPVIITGLINLPILVLLLIISGFNIKPHQYTITSNINAPSGTRFYLTYEYLGKEVKDSAISKSNVFQFTGTFPEPVICTLSNTANKQIRIFIAENGTIRLSGEFDKLYEVKVDNAKEQALYDAYKNKSGRITTIYRTSLRQTGGDTHDKNHPAYVHFQGQKDSLVTAFVKENNSSIAAVLCIIDSYITYPDRPKAIACYQLLTKTAKNTIYGKRIGQFIEAAATISPGHAAPEIVLKDLKGRSVALSSYKGKYVLLDFWASWCAPCRKEHPFLRKLYSELRSDRLEFVSVSMDASNSSWKQAVIADELIWKQLNDPKSLNGAVADIYGVKSLPFNCLIDPNGFIVATRLDEKDLETHLTKIIRDK
ncbi:TlpA disulfide reductase family protein [Mucilaginibacter sp. PAMB04274]|uniref:TlpA disulfide reductase family protein n=1 Tax=Mucilaginibacter sp. PAMB04274 TaxID=3138568 RepID=UPI0031F61378